MDKPKFEVIKPNLKQIDAVLEINKMIVEINQQITQNVCRPLISYNIPSEEK